MYKIELMNALYLQRQYRVSQSSGCRISKSRMKYYNKQYDYLIGNELFLCMKIEYFTLILLLKYFIKLITISCNFKNV